MRTLRRQWPVCTALILFWVVVGALVAVSVGRNDGHLVYALDDAYIHMAMAKNVAEHGVWGVTQYAFSSTSSSPLWTSLLSGIYVVFGPATSAPLVLNLVFASLLIVAFDRLLWSGRVRAATGLRLLVLLAVILLTPLPSLVLTGMEHSLHILLAVAFAGWAVRAFGGSSPRTSSRDAGLPAALVVLLVLTRYEALFLIAPAVLLLLIRRRWALGGLLATTAIAPLALYGWLSARSGGFWLPNSVLLKGQVPGVGGGLQGIPGYAGYRLLLATPHLLALLTAALVMCGVFAARRRPSWQSSGALVALYGVAVALHVQFARVGSAYRYEAYLVTLGLFVVAWLCVERWHTVNRPLPWPEAAPSMAAFALAALLAVAPLVERGAFALAQIARATTNIYQQQIQMGRFLARYYSGATIAANDIGAIDFLADIRCVDLTGLATQEVARLRLADQYDREAIAALTSDRGVRVAVVYDHWYSAGGIAGMSEGRPGGLPVEWVKVGEWQIPDNIVSGSDIVSLYAVDPAAAPALAAQLAEFAAGLPSGVRHREYPQR